MKNKILLYLQVFTKTLRVSLLQNTFGFTSHCKHTPTCGDYCFEMIRKHGVRKGLLLGISRLKSCW